MRTQRNVSKDKRGLGLTDPGSDCTLRFRAAHQVRQMHRRLQKQGGIGPGPRRDKEQEL